jgi:hypothetical protein
MRQSMPSSNIDSCAGGQRHSAILRLRPNEAALLKPLGEQAQTLSVPAQHLDQIAALAAEHEQLSAERILAKLPLGQRGQAVKALPHVGVTARQPTTHVRRRRDHPRNAAM